MLTTISVATMCHHLDIIMLFTVFPVLYITSHELFFYK